MQRVSIVCLWMGKKGRGRKGEKGSRHGIRVMKDRVRAVGQ